MHTFKFAKMSIECTDAGFSAGKHAAVITLITSMGNIFGSAIIGIDTSWLSEDSFVGFHREHAETIKILGEYLQLFAYMTAGGYAFKGILGLRKNDK